MSEPIGGAAISFLLAVLCGGCFGVGWWVGAGVQKKLTHVVKTEKVSPKFYKHRVIDEPQQAAIERRQIDLGQRHRVLEELPDGFYREFDRSV